MASARQDLCQALSKQNLLVSEHNSCTMWGHEPTPLQRTDCLGRLEGAFGRFKPPQCWGWGDGSAAPPPDSWIGSTLTTNFHLLFDVFSPRRAKKRQTKRKV